MGTNGGQGTVEAQALPNRGGRKRLKQKADDTARAARHRIAGIFFRSGEKSTLRKIQMSVRFIFAKAAGKSSACPEFDRGTIMTAWKGSTKKEGTSVEKFGLPYFKT
jgi:hypothetical protein